MNEITFNDLEGNQIKFILDNNFYTQGRLTIVIDIDGYLVNGHAWIVTGELVGFYNDLSNMYKTMKGKTVFSDTENQLNLHFSFTVHGYVNIKGRYKKRHERETVLIFELECSQPQLLETLQQMEKIDQLNPKK